MSPDASAENRIDDRRLKLLLSVLLRRHSSCLDVGAIRGSFLRDFLRMARHGRPIYEPEPNRGERLVRLLPDMDIPETGALRPRG